MIELSNSIEYQYKSCKVVCWKIVNLWQVFPTPARSSKNLSSGAEDRRLERTIRGKNSRWKPSFLLSFWHSCSRLLGAWGLKKLLKHFQHYKRTKWALTVFLSLNIFWKKRNSCWCIISDPLSSKLGLFPGIFGTSAFRRFPGIKRKYSTTWKRRLFFKFILSFKFYKFTFTEKLIDLQL